MYLKHEPHKIVCLATAGVKKCLNYKSFILLNVERLLLGISPLKKKEEKEVYSSPVHGLKHH